MLIHHTSNTPIERTIRRRKFYCSVCLITLGALIISLGNLNAIKVTAIVDAGLTWIPSLEHTLTEVRRAGKSLATRMTSVTLMPRVVLTNSMARVFCFARVFLTVKSGTALIVIRVA